MNKVINFINSFFGGGVVGDILDKFLPDKAEKMAFEQALRQELFKTLELEFKDMENARLMQIEALKQNDLFSKRFVYILSAFVLLNSIFAGVLAFLVEFPEANRDLVSMYYSFSFITGGAQMMRFFFGSNNNSNTLKNE